MSRRATTDFIVVHCSWSKAELDIGAAEIDRWHKRKGWRKIGYHFVIRRDGTVEQGRKLENRGAHVRGLNDNSIGICLIGGMGDTDKDEDNFTQHQRNALSDTLVFLHRVYPKAKIRPHSYFDRHKTCPVMDLEPFLARLVRNCRLPSEAIGD